jgi:hypothetical protein
MVLWKIPKNREGYRFRKLEKLGENDPPKLIAFVIKNERLA